MPAGRKAMDYANFEYGFKMILVGDSAVGKTSMLHRYVKDTFNEDYDYTAAVDFENVFEEVRGSRIKLTIWDTAGQERVHTFLFATYYRHATIALIVYDVSRGATFGNVPRWLQLVRENCPEDVVIGLVGMKIDLAAKKEVSTKEGKAFASRHGLLFFETLAIHSDSSLPKVFREPCRKVLDKVRKTAFTKEELWGMGACVGKLHKKYRFYSTSTESDVTDLAEENRKLEDEGKSCAC